MHVISVFRGLRQEDYRFRRRMSSEDFCHLAYHLPAAYSDSRKVRFLLMYPCLFPVLTPKHKLSCHFQPGQSVPVFWLSLVLSWTSNIYPEI